ncbi:MAG TPA: response regulator [Myxococcales bacterium]|nr:response regulator [Myxococcales bacterium]
MEGPLRVLVAEDNEDDYELLLRELGRTGCELQTLRVQTAADMTRALDDRSWDIVFSDWSMPDFSALAALALVKGKQLDVPFIIVSGTVGEEIAVEALKSGAHDFLTKHHLPRLLPAVEREIREAKIRRERNKMQEQLMISDRMASVGILAAGVAHEINNPLACVLANLDLAVRDFAETSRELPASPRLQDLHDELADAREAATRIRHIVRDLKLFSRAEEEGRRGLDVQRVLESALRMAWNEIRHRARLVKNYAPTPLVEANESRLGQVFLNLIVNAAQSIPEGRAEANEIRVATGLGPGGRVMVEIGDTGSGMPPEILKRLFTPFFTTKPVGIGTGLGLSICHRIVAALGGEISVESTLGRGSMFRVFLPAAPQGIESAEAPVPSLQPAARRARILVVDDEPLVGHAIRKTLAHDHEVLTLQRAQEALDRIRGGARYDVILCDLMMPEMTGMDLHAALVNTVRDQADKMIFLTGGAFTSRARAFLDAVANLRLEKPFDAVSLRAIVNERVR